MPGEQSSDRPAGTDVPVGLYDGQINDAFGGHVFVFADDEFLNCSIEHPQECREHPTRTMSQCPSSMMVRGMSHAPVGEPGRYVVKVDRGAVLFERDDNARPRGLFDRLEEGLLAAGGGQVVLTSPDPGVDLAMDISVWRVGLVFGQEADDSPMAGGAAYGSGPSLQQALRAALDEAGWA